jgi:hypothetical protein
MIFGKQVMSKPSEPILAAAKISDESIRERRTCAFIYGPLVLIALLVDAGLFIVRFALLVGEPLPHFAENLTNVAYAS